jgi:hypothetical protein
VDLRDRRDLYNGFGDGLARAFELAVTPAIFGVIGYGLDRWIGIVPVFTIVFALVTLCVKGYLMWLDYEQAMRRHDEASPWGRKLVKPAPPVEQPHG